MYAVLDIEATGGQKGEEEIIEIAIYRFDGKEITDQFFSLVKADRNIDPYVQKLTGITPKLIRSAPKFHEIAKRVVEITSGTTLVGHNVDFDYRMLRQEFIKLGYKFQTQTIDTLPLSQDFFPEVNSYSLGKLCKELGIPVTNRHRASGDAKATLELFKILLQKDSVKDISKTQIESPIKSGRYSAHYDELPNTSGLVYFYDKNNEVIFISRSQNISLDVKKILTGKSQLKYQIQKTFHSIRFEETGSSLISEIKEIYELKKLKPVLNVSGKEIRFPNSICLYESNGYKLFSIEHSKRNCKKSILKFKRLSGAGKMLLNLTEEYRLCPKLNKISPPEADCFNYKMGLCNGACVGEEPFEKYNIRVDEILEKINLENKNFLILDRGRKLAEKSFIWIKNGYCKGYGYFEFHNQIEDEKTLTERMTAVDSNPVIDILIKNFLISDKNHDIFPLNSE